MSKKLLLLLILSVTALPLHARDAIRFAPLPMENTKEVIKQFKPMLDYLEKSLEIGIEIVYMRDYQVIIDEFKAGEIDFAFLGPLPYVILSEDYEQVSPLVRFLNQKGEETYTCSLVRVMETDTTDLQGKRVALTQPYSTCGYLSTSYLLQKLGTDIEKTLYRYTGSHSEVALGVARGEYEVGGLKTAIGHKFTHMGLELIANTEPLPGFVLAGNRATLSAKMMGALAGALLKLRPLENAVDAKLTATWGKNIRYGAVPADNKDFAGVRDKLAHIKLPMDGNF